MLVDWVNEFIVIDITRSNNYDIVTEVVCGVEISDSISINVLNIVSVSLFGLTQHVLSIDIVVSIFNQSFKVSMVVIFMFLWNFFFNKL